ncbi:MAG: hypothetical protein KF708_20780 [Pirellulales bacterium]|nr:hypothetical protein [Pirellulales bacterium]
MNWLPWHTCLLAIVGVALWGSPSSGADEYEAPPIEYSLGTPDNRISQLQGALERRETSLEHEPELGYLRDLLRKLEIREDSQMLVFSKSSMQRNRISPHTPRALYFNDDSYLGYCRGGEVIELAVADPQLGAVFYTLEQTKQEVPVIERQTHQCLQCHGGSQTDNIPGLLVRSMIVGPSGLPILSEGSHFVDPTTPLADRWGGWYVSGTHGTQTHLGNFILRSRDEKRPWNNSQGLNVTDLGDRFAAEHYLNAHSDLVALMVFEHQTHVHNLITKANFTTRQALEYEQVFNKALGEPASHRLDSTTRRIAHAGDKLLEGLLMVDEAKFSSPLAGTSTFAQTFARPGPRDAQGRSLRDLDLQQRMFKYPCSYLIYSEDFDALPSEMMVYLRTRLGEILAGRGGERFSHLTPQDRAAIREILQDTKPALLEAL